MILATAALEWDKWPTMAIAIALVINHKVLPVTMDKAIGQLEETKPHAPTTVNIFVNGQDGNEVYISENEEKKLTCIHDGHPTPNITWETYSRRDKRWKLYSRSENLQTIIVNSSLIGLYRCKAANDLNKNNATISSNQINVQLKAEENFMLIAGIALGCLGAVIIMLVIFVRIGWEKSGKTKKATGDMSIYDDATSKNISSTQSSDNPLLN